MVLFGVLLWIFQNPERGKNKNKQSDAKDASDDELDLLDQAKQRTEQQSQRNQREFEDDPQVSKTMYEGYAQGMYVRIVLKDVPNEFLENFHPSRPVIIGGLLANETKMGYIAARVKRHRWHKKVLKSQDPLLFSIGWRRFQVISYYFLHCIDVF